MKTQQNKTKSNTIQYGKVYSNDIKPLVRTETIVGATFVAFIITVLTVAL